MSQTLAIDQRFDKIDAQFQELRQDMDKQFDRIASVVVKGFEQNKREHEQMATKEEVARIFDLLDQWAKRHEISEDERLVMGHQLDRLNRWVEALADKIGYKLTY